jgi:ABC-type Zn uptake system ZnuABC Zn-binding protein ZnuA
MRAVMLCLMLMACSKEPTFDEQFENEAAEIEAKAEKIERDLNAQMELVPEATEAEKSDALSEKPAK